MHILPQWACYAYDRRLYAMNLQGQFIHCSAAARPCPPDYTQNKNKLKHPPRWSPSAGGANAPHHSPPPWCRSLGWCRPPSLRRQPPTPQRKPLAPPPARQSSRTDSSAVPTPADCFPTAPQRHPTGGDLRVRVMSADAGVRCSNRRRAPTRGARSGSRAATEGGVGERDPSTGCRGGSVAQPRGCRACCAGLAPPRLSTAVTMYVPTAHTVDSRPDGFVRRVKVSAAFFSFIYFFFLCVRVLPPLPVP